MEYKYFLKVLTDENEFVLIRELSKEKYMKFAQASTLLSKLNTKLYFFRMVDYDFMELKDFEREYNNQININPLSVDIDELLFEFFKLLHNYLSSINLFLNQYSANVKRDYDDGLFGEFEELRNNLHYEHLSYRIIYELRNEVHHSNIPSVHFKAQRNYYGKLEAKIYIQKDFLKIGKLKNDEEFSQLDDLIDIYGHIENMNSYLMVLAKQILKYELDIHMDYYDFLKELVDEVDIGGKVCVFRFKEITPIGFEPIITFLNQKLLILIDKIKEYKDEL